MKIKTISFSIFLSLINFFSFAQELELLTGPFYDTTNYIAPPPLIKELKGIIPITHYQQCNQSWSGNLYGIGNCSTICANGCAMSSGAMLLKVNGVNVNPGQLNSWLQNNAGYSGCNVLWTSVDNYPGSTMTWYGSATYSLSIIKSEIDAGNPVIVHVNRTSPCAHFLVIYGYNGSGANTNDFLVADPATSIFPKYWSDYTVCSETYALRIFHHVYTPCTNPNTPISISPGTISSPGTIINTITPTLTWSTVSGATDYDVFIRKDPLTSGPLVLQQYCVSGNTFVVPSNVLVNNGLYRWNAQANVNCNQCESGYSSPLYFQVQTNVGIDKDNGTVNISFFPNPNNGDFTIELFVKNNEEATIEIINNLGQIVYKQLKRLNLGNNKIEINLKNAMEGIYVLKLNMQNNDFIQKIIINKHE